ncbi:MAG: LptF/LptG family permease, partial [Rhizobiaceae bacterium]
MIGRTLGIYLAKDFLRNMVFIFILFFLLIIAVDLIELSRDLGKTVNAGFKDIFLISLFRAPAFAENILPFSILFGASMSLLMLNRRLELVVARASGVSAWQFLWPLMLTAATIGVLATFVYNPLSLSGTIASRAVEASVFGKAKGGFSNKSKNFWLRINETSGDVVLRAKISQNKGLKLTAVSAYRFAADGSFKERVDAARAKFVTEKGQNYYVLSDADITIPGQRSRKQKQVKLAVLVSKSQLQSGQTNASETSIWSLNKQASRAEESGKSALAFETRFHALLAQPLLFIAMVLLAATISLTFARFGVNGKVILGGISAGFVLYVL